MSGRASAGFIANFENNIVIAVEFRDNIFDMRRLPRKQFGVTERKIIEPFDFFQFAKIVFGVERIQFPNVWRIGVAEQDHFDNDAKVRRAL